MPIRLNPSKIVMLISIISTLVSSSLLPVSANVQSETIQDVQTAYNRSAAVKWALKNNYNDGRFWGDTTHGRYCTTYVTRAMQAGGMDVPSYTGNVQLANWLRAHPETWEIRAINQLEPGDIIFLNNAGAIPDNLSLSWIDHVVLVTAKGKYSQWNAERANKNFAKLAKWKYEKGIHFKVGVSSTTVDLPTQFIGNPGITLKDNKGKANLTICADNLAGSTVHVLFRWPNGVRKDGTPKWVNLTYSKKAVENCVVFKNIDGPAVLAKGVVYEARAAINRLPDSGWQAGSCLVESNYQGLCKTLRKNNK